MSDRGPFGAKRPLSLAAVDAAISETIGKPVRADRLARDDNLYRTICRWAIAEGTMRFNCTYAQLAKAAGYDVPRLTCRANRKEARRRRQSTVYRALSSLQAAGLVRFHERKREDGRSRCLSVGLTPAAYGPEPPFGRSPRRPTRCPGGRISFSRRSGSPAPLATAKNGIESVDVRARAREGPGKAGEEAVGAFLAAALAPTEAPSDPHERRSWPTERFDVRDERAVILVELFEESFGIPAQFSFERHGPLLARYLDRFDRFTGAAGDRYGFAADGRRRRAGAGLREAARLIAQRGALYRAGNRRLQRVRSLAYFLPKLDQESKRRRREWKRTYGEDSP